MHSSNVTKSPSFFHQDLSFEESFQITKPIVKKNFTEETQNADEKMEFFEAQNQNTLLCFFVTKFTFTSLEKANDKYFDVCIYFFQKKSNR